MLFEGNAVGYWLWRKMRGDERREIRWVVAVAGSFLLVCWILLLLWSDSSRRETVTQGERELFRTQQLAADKTVQSLRQLDLVTRLLAEWLARHPERDFRTDRELAELMSGLHSGLSGTWRVHLLAPDRSWSWQGQGWQAESAMPVSPPKELGASDILLVGEPVSSGERVGTFLPLFRKVPGRPSGAWGVHSVMVMLAPGELRNLYGALLAAPGRVITLTDSGQRPLAGFSAESQALTSIAALSGEASGKVGILERDGQRNWLIWQKIEGYPLGLAVSVPESQLLQSWREQSLIVLLAVAALSLLIVRLAFSLLRMLDRLVADREELLRLATTDALTGLLNRRIFLQRLEDEFERSRRYGMPLSLLMLDCDHFKLVNDGYGHAVGDQALQNLALWGQESLRSCDIFARMGGEEFAVLLPETSLNQAVEVAERLRQTVAEHPLQTFAGNLVLTVSIGVAQVEAGDLTVEAVLVRADQALYAAKHGGRNRVGGIPASNDALAGTPPSARDVERQGR